MAKKNSATAVKDDPPPQEDKVEQQQDENDEETSSEAGSSSEGGEEVESSEEEAPKTTPPPKTNPKDNSAEDDEDEDEDEEETDTDEDEPPPKTKPIEQTLKSKPSIAPARSGTKRPAENNDTKQSNKKKTTASSAEEKNKKKEKEPEEDDNNNNKKTSFQRVFTADDEVAILQGLVDFTAKSGNDPTKHLSAFYQIVKKSVHFKVTLDQLRDKVRRLRLRFENKCKSGKTPTFSKPIEETMFELSKKIWGGGKVDVNEGEENGKVNGKAAKKEPAVKKAAAARTTKKLVMEPDSPLVVSKEIRKGESGNGKEDTGLSLVSNEAIHFEPVIDVVKRGVESIEESKRGELERLTNKYRIAEMELFMQKTELAKETATKIRDALNSSSSH